MVEINSVCNLVFLSHKGSSIDFFCFFDRVSHLFDDWKNKQRLTGKMEFSDMATEKIQGLRKPWTTPKVIVSEAARDTEKFLTTTTDKPNVLGTDYSYASGHS